MAMVPTQLNSGSVEIHRIHARASDSESYSRRGPSKHEYWVSPEPATQWRFCLAMHFGPSRSFCQLE